MKFNISIRTRLLAFFLIVLLVPSVLIGSLSYVSSQNTVAQEIKSSALEKVNLLNYDLDHMIQSKVQDLDFLSPIPASDSPTTRDLLARFQNLHPDLECTYVGTDTGLYISAPEAKLPDGYDPRKRPWYQQAFENKGKVVITEPFLSLTSGNVVVTIAKVTADGKGVVAIDLSLQALAKTVSAIKIGQTGYVFVVDKANKFIVHPDEKAGTDAKGPQYEFMANQTTGSDTYLLDGVSKELVFVTNPTTGWKLAGTMYTQEFSDAAKPIFKTTLIVMVVSIVFGVVIGYFLIRSITQPLNRLKAATEIIAQGDLTERLAIHSQDELGQLSRNFNTMTESLRSVLSQLSASTSQVASSSVQLTASSQQSSEAAEHTALTMQNLAEGTQQQMQSVEETDLTVQELTTSVEQVARRAESLSLSATETSELAQQGNETIQKAVLQMNSISHGVEGLSQRMDGLGEHAHSIGKIIDGITEIAAQTNLLSLNAAIEAARAGEHGRGFAVVADEVRKLAEQTTSMAHQIGEYISTIQAEILQAVDAMRDATADVSTGIHVVHVAGDSFRSIHEAVHKSALQIHEVSSAVQQIAAGSHQVLQSIEMIKTVSEQAADSTQTVSAVTEEQLASMEEIASSASALSELAEELETLLQKFTL